MQIWPGSSLLQAIAKSAEPKPVPFAQRLADLATVGPARVAPAAPDQTLPASRSASTGPLKPRGSVIDIVV